MALDPVVLFFVLGALGGLFKSELKIPKSYYDSISIYLLLSIGIKGGKELFTHPAANFPIVVPVIICTGIMLTFTAYFLLRKLGRFDQTNSIAIAMHYGSVSAVTFAVASSYIVRHNLPYESYMTAMLVLLEIPGLGAGIFMAKRLTNKQDNLENIDNKDKNINVANEKEYKTKSNGTAHLLHEVFFNKSIILLLGGMIIGYYIAWSGKTDLNFFYTDLFKGFLSLFMIELGIVTSKRFVDVKKVGPFLVAFGVLMPLVGGFIGLLAAKLLGLSIGGAVILAALCSSASYIAAPATVKAALPKANPGYYMTLALGITFPFNIIFGISIYHYMAIWMGF